MQADAAEISADTGSKVRLIGLQHLDNRTRASRRARSLAESFMAELGENTSTAQRIAVERAATMVVLAEDARARRLAGERIPLDDVVRADRTAAAAVKALGLDQRKREPVTPTLHDYVRSRAAKMEAAE